MTPDGGAGRREVRVLVLGGGALLAAVMWLVTAATAPKPPPPGATAPRPQVNYVARGDEAAARVRRLAREVKGDFDRLAPADQDWLDAMSAGHGRELIRARYQEGRGGGKPASGAGGAEKGAGAGR